VSLRDLTMAAEIVGRLLAHPRHRTRWVALALVPLHARHDRAGARQAGWLFTNKTAAGIPACGSSACSRWPCSGRSRGARANAGSLGIRREAHLSTTLRADRLLTRSAVTQHESGADSDVKL